MAKQDRPIWLNVLFIISAIFAGLGITLMAVGLILALKTNNVQWPFVIIGVVLVIVSTLINMIIRALK